MSLAAAFSTDCSRRVR